jgi:hypothetical protein
MKIRILTPVTALIAVLMTLAFILPSNASAMTINDLTNIYLDWIKGGGDDGHHAKKKKKKKKKKMIVVPGPTADPVQALLGTNDSGMHCIDSDYSIFSILPPGNHVFAQVIQKGTQPQFITDATAYVTYQAVADPTGSINTTSVGKTNFWTFVAALFGVSLPVNTGFQGQMMPGAANTPQRFLTFDAATHKFNASGIPITPIDDSGATNNYPLMHIVANTTAGVAQAALDEVVPVSTEMHCSNCHATGQVAATAGFGGVSAYSTLTNLDLQTRTNILLLHDALNGTSLNANKPVACKSCHYSAANDLLVNGSITATDLNPVNSFSRMIHGNHGRPNSLIGGAIPIPENGIQTCYQCHPGQTTQCYRGAMFEAGLICQNCHGGLLQVAGANTTGSFPDDAVVTWPTTTGQLRRPWIDLPLCQSCHTGDVNYHLGASLILRQAYDPANGASASPRLATNKRFAEPNGGPGSLFNGIPMRYQDGLGHNGVACESCHGSPHAVWPTNKTNDNIASIEAQGHAGMISECVVCHGAGFSPRGLDGPHGLHVINSSTFVNGGHEDLYESNPASCQACHGAMLEGTVLSKAQADRTFTVEGGTRTIAQGTMVGCTLCHGNPINGGG